jgi:PAS domain S-box-containing protein
MISLVQYLEFLQTIPYPCITVYEKSRIVLVNRYAEEFFGYTSDELAGRLIETLLPKLFQDEQRPQRVTDVLDDASAGLKVKHQKSLAVQKSGTNAVEIRINPVVMNGDQFHLLIIRSIGVQTV